MEKQHLEATKVKYDDLAEQIEEMKEELND
jgi:hypothetical protein